MNIHDRVTGYALAMLLLAGMAWPSVHAADLPALSHSLTRQAPRTAPPLKLKDLDGTVHDLAQFKGRVVLVNFWATWCPPCRREMPSMARLSQALAGEAFSVLAVDVGEDADTIDAFASQLDTPPNFPVLLDTRSHALQAWKVAGLPTTFLVDRRGRIIATAIGGREFDHPEMLSLIRGLLEE